MPATAVREMSVCVMFGAPRVGRSVTSCRRPIFGHLFDVAHGDVFWTNVTINSPWLDFWWRMLPSRTTARAGVRPRFACIATCQFSSMHRLRCWRFVSLPHRVWIYERQLLDMCACLSLLHTFAHHLFRATYQPCLARRVLYALAAPPRPVVHQEARTHSSSSMRRLLYKLNLETVPHDFWRARRGASNSDG